MKKPIVIVAVLFVLTMLFFGLHREIKVPPSGLVYYLKPGESKAQLTAELSTQGVLPNARFFLLYAELHAGTPLKTGEYYFAPGTSVRGLWRQVSQGTGHYYRAFTIVPGWTFAQVRQQLIQTTYLRHTSTLMDNDNLMALISGEAKSPEGQFLPETYYYLRNDVDVSVLKRAYNLMQRSLTNAWNQRAADLPFTSSYDALIAASLVEREAYLAAERPVIAGVLINRLNNHMRLQFDPTVIYGMGTTYQGKITKIDLQTDTPYNTYMHQGLPPTPIAMPSIGAIQATLHPLRSDYLYFVARGDGSHQFSKTLAEHNAAVQQSIMRKAGSSMNVPVVQKEIERLLIGQLTIVMSPQPQIL